ncbi:MAG: FG-GAP-like repeat-containing protein, partial [Cyclobacteriaceae bacterium]
KKTLSNGAVYADLDNDGDLDLVTNNINEPPSLYQNNEDNGNHYLNVKLEGNGGNIDGFNAKVIAYQGEHHLIRYVNPYRGFMSSMLGEIHIGLGDLTVDSLIVIWGDEKKSVIHRPSVDTTLVVTQKSASPSGNLLPKIKSKYSIIQGLGFSHKEDALVDFHIQPLLPARLSCEGPALAVGDLNGDGLDDVFIGGAVGQASVIGFQNKQGFELVDLPNQNIYEDVKADIVDFNGDGFNDLFVSTGGYTNLNDRVYFGPFDETGIPNPIHLPYETISTGALAIGDYDQDGDVDVFVGGRFVPGQYPDFPWSTLLVNESGTFTTADGWPRKLGLVTDAQWGDLNGDDTIDLIIAREWSSLGALYGYQGVLGKVAEFGPPGLWKSIELYDLDQDGSLDILAGNYGLNNDFNVSVETPMEMYSADFDRNGAIDPIITRFYQEESFPVAPRDALLRQIPFMQTRVFKYQAYANSKISDLLAEDDLNAATHYKVTELRSGVFLNRRKGISFVPFPMRAQYGPIQDMEVIGEDKAEVLLIGNDYDREVLGGRQDAMGGVLLSFENDSFSVKTTFKLGNTRKLEQISFEGENYWLVGQNNDSLKVLNPAYFHQ